MTEWKKKFDELSLARGRNMAHSGKIRDLQRSETEIAATVAGVPGYNISIALRDGEPIRMKCQCPKFRGRGSCEHLAAVLFLAFEGDGQGQAPEGGTESGGEKRAKAAAGAGEGPQPDAAKEAAAQKRDGSVRRLTGNKKEHGRSKRETEEADGQQSIWDFLDAEDSHMETNNVYCYFDFAKLREALKLSKGSIKKGRALQQRSAVSNMDLSSGYTDSREEMVVDVSAKGKDGKREFSSRIVFSRNEVLYVECGCPECISKYWSWYIKHRDCAWVSALLDMSEAHILQHGIGDATDKLASRVLWTFGQKRANQIVAEAAAQGESLHLVPRLQAQGDRLRLSFRVGSGKLFVIKNLFEFCEHVENSETSTYGSGTQINHHLENFTQESREWYGFIHKVVQEEERLEQRMEEKMRFSYRESRLNAVELYGWRLDQFYEMLGNKAVEYEKKNAEGKEKGSLMRREANPEIVLHIRKSETGREGEFHGIEVSCQLPEFFYGVNDAYYADKGVFCRVKKEFMQHIQALADASLAGKLKLRIGRRKLQEFYYSVLPMLGDSVKVEEEDAEEIRAFLPPEAVFIFYLDARDGTVTCRAHAQYGEQEVSLLDHLAKKEWSAAEDFRIMSREQEVLYQVMQTFPECLWEQDELCCGTDEELVYQALEHGVEKLAELGEVRCTQRFRSMNVIRRVKISVGVSVSEGLLNLDIGTEDISRQELLDILKGYRARQKYFRLKNGDFLKLEDNSLELLDEMMRSLQLSAREFVKGKMHIPAYRALYMDRLLEGNENIYNTRDSRFKKMVQNFKTISDADFEEPQSLSRILRGYQKNGFKWLKTLESYGFGGILADDMGLGKTVQMIAVLLDAKLGGRQGTSLIVCPASLVYNWEEELHRFAPQLSVLAIAGGQDARHERLSKSGEYDVLITSYDLLKRDLDQYEDKTFLYEVIDEAQYIKNHTTAAAKAVKAIKSGYKFALTGTPIENRLSELWSIFDYLMPGFLYSYDVFRREMETPVVKAGDETALRRLQGMTGPFILRRLKEDVLKDLPDKLEEVRYVQLEETQRRVYDAQVVHMQELLARQSSEDFGRNKMQVLAELTRLRRICCDPSLCFENYSGGSAKLDACMELVMSAVDGGHKLLLFSQFTTMLERMQSRLDGMNIPFYTITGETGKEKRLELVKRFNGDDTPVFLISLKAGGVGLNLTGADVVIHYDPWWNLAAQEQATDRAHRIGQTKKVTVYKLIARQTVEEKILDLQESKKNLADSVVSAQEGQLAGMSREELMALLEV